MTVAAGAAFATVLAACGGGGRAASVLPPPGVPPTQAPVAAPGTVALHITIPSLAALSAFRKPGYISPATNSLTFSQNGGAKQTIALTTSSPACTTVVGVRTCTALVSATAGASQSFALALFASADGSGQPLARRTIVVDVASGRENPVTATLDGVVASVTLRFAPAALQYGEPSQTGAVVVNALDAAGQVIIGPGVFVDANGNAVTITLSNRDTSGFTALAPATITQSTTVPLTYTGGAVTGAKFDAAASNGPAATATLPIVCASPGSNPVLYMVDEAGYGLAPLKESAFYGSGLDLPLGHRVTTRANGPIAVDGRGFVYVLAGATDFTKSYVLQFCPSAYGVATPYRSFVSPLAQQQNMTVSAGGDVFTVGYVPENAIYRFAADSGPIGPPGASPAAVAARIAGPNTQLFGPSALAVDASGTLYAGNAGQVTAYSAGANGDVAPSRTIVNTAGGLLVLNDAATDAAGNVYALYYRNNLSAHDPASPFGVPAVVEYLHGAFSAPARVISGPNTQMSTGRPLRIAVDLAGNIYVLRAADAGDGITVNEKVLKFGPTANGDVAPNSSFDVATVGGIGSGFESALAVSAGGNVAVASYGHGIYIYSNAGAQLAVIPSSSTLGVVRSLTYDAAGHLAALTQRSATGMGTNALLTYAPNPGDNALPATVNAAADAISYYQIAYDATGNLRAAGRTSSTVGFLVGMVDTFAPGSTTGTPPQRLTLPENYSIGVTGLGFDALGDIYVASPSADSIYAYAPGTSGNALQTGAYSDYRPSTLNVQAVATDAAGNVYVADCKYPSSVSVYAPGTTGVPSRAIIGPKTGIDCPSKLAVDADGYLYVEYGQAFGLFAIAVFAPGASGDVAPVQTIQLEAPVALRLPQFAIGPEFATFPSSSLRAALKALAARAPTSSRRRHPSTSATCAPVAPGPSLPRTVLRPCER